MSSTGTMMTDEVDDPKQGLLGDSNPVEKRLKRRPGTRRKLLWLIGAVIMTSLLGLAVALAVIYTAGGASTAGRANTEGFTLDDIITGKFYPESHNGTWISGNEFSYKTADGAINIYNVATSTASIIIPANIATQLRISTYKFSPDRKYVLYSFDPRQSYRYSNSALYSIIDLATFTSYKLQPTNIDPQVYLRYVTWNKQGNSLIYVYENNIYFRQMPTNVMDDVQLTTDGEPEGVFNGVPDWVYEEEVLSQDNAIWIANSGKRMVYATFDDRQVDQMEFSLFGSPGLMQFQYPVTTAIRYPKAGRTNPNVTLSVTDITADKVTIRELHPPAQVSAMDHYFTTIAWATDDEVMIAWLNRHQNESQFSFCNIKDGTCSTELNVTEPKGWVDQYSPPKFSKDGRKMIFILPVEQSGGVGNFKHAVLFNRDTGELRPLTNGRWEVTEIVGWEESSNTVYVVGTAVDKPAQRHLYKVNTLSKNDKEPVCATCGTLNLESKECTYNSVDFSQDLSYYVHGCDGPNVPRSVIKETKSGKEVFVSTNNEALLDRLSTKVQPRNLSMQVPLGNGYMAQVRLLLPPSLNRNKAQKYPMLVYVYGGPHSQQVSDRFRIDWGSHLASSRGVIYALIDGRGSGYQGDKLLHEIYHRMGTVEIEDQIRVAKFLKENLPFVDGNQTAIWGWSYGGFATASVLASDTENVFKCGMAVAPVTNWIYYDSIYTERYMGLPTASDNLQGYMDSDVCSKAANFRNKQFYLIHGTADDNVHYQQSLMLAKALEGADVLFRQQSYTDENHSIGNYRKHLYHSLGTFLMTDCFGMENEVWG